MTLSFRIEPRHVIECDCCTGHMEEHEEGCPRAQMQAMSLNGPDCPRCHRGKLLPNVNDYLECRFCKSQFSRSQIVAGYSPDTLIQHTVVDYDANEHFAVLEIPDKGRGEFRYKAIVRSLNASIAARQKMMRKSRDRSTNGESGYRRWLRKKQEDKLRKEFDLTQQLERGTPS